MTVGVLKHFMCLHGNREIIQWLFSTGVNINDRSDHPSSLQLEIAGYWDPLTPLQRAAWAGDISLIQELIEYGADVNESSSDGDTALEVAAQRGYFGIVQRLLELGVNPNAPGDVSHGDRTAIESAAEHGRLDIVQLLLNSGAETSGRGRRQFVRSVGLADREGHHAIVRLLKSHAGWTEADEDLLGQQDLTPVGSREVMRVPAYVRRYYGDESDGEDPAGDVISKEYESRDALGATTEEFQYSDRLNSDSEEHASNSEEASQALAEESFSRNADTSETCLASDDNCCRVHELTEELDEPSETFLSTSDLISKLPDAYESLSKEVGFEFLPSSMSYQIREELEGGGCLEESGGDLWAEEYSRFITELV
uniref:Multiple ankyrin repeats single kh domain-containing protein n=1 Tax=Colletotrichum fructicola (strain Nara gc5) TaxID=1213859 RepID=L2FZT5_COLFN